MRTLVCIEFEYFARWNHLLALYYSSGRLPAFLTSVHSFFPVAPSNSNQNRPTGSLATGTRHHHRTECEFTVLNGRTTSFLAQFPTSLRALLKNNTEECSNTTTRNTSTNSSGRAATRTAAGLPTQEVRCTCSQCKIHFPLETKYFDLNGLTKCF